MESKGNRKIFLTFNDILLTPDISVMKALKEPKMKQSFDGIIDYTRFEFMNDDNLLRLSIQKTHPNILNYLGNNIPNFDYDKMYRLICKNLQSKYTDSPCLSMVNSMAMSLATSYVGELIVHSDEYDLEIETELGAIFNANTAKIKYVYGDIEQCIAGHDISLFVFANVETVVNLMSKGMLTGKEVLVANYGYNYKLDEDGELAFKFDITSAIKNDTLFKMRTFAPFELSERHMSQLHNNVEENNNLSLG